MSNDARPEPQDGFPYSPSAEDWKEYEDFLDSLKNGACDED